MELPGTSDVRIVEVNGHRCYPAIGVTVAELSQHVPKKVSAISPPSTKIVRG